MQAKPKRICIKKQPNSKKNKNIIKTRPKLNKKLKTKDSY